MSLTPHGPGFSFLDAFEIKDGEGLGRKWLDPALPFFADHFPGQPLMPGVLLIECGAQTAGALWASVLGANQKQAFQLAQVIQFKMLKAVHPGETVETSARMENTFGQLAQFDLVLRVGGAEVARGRIVLARPV